MRQLTRLLRYLAPYSWQFIPSVILLAGVGFLDAFRVLLVGPVLDRVLNPSSGSENISLFTIPHTHHTIYLQELVPSRFHNAWTIVAFAFVASTVLKGIFDYTGTYLVNYAGYGLITDLYFEQKMYADCARVCKELLELNTDDGKDRKVVATIADWSSA